MCQTYMNATLPLIILQLRLVCESQHTTYTIPFRQMKSIQVNIIIALLTVDRTIIASKKCTGGVWERDSLLGLYLIPILRSTNQYLEPTILQENMYTKGKVYTIPVNYNYVHVYFVLSSSQERV